MSAQYAPYKLRVPNGFQTLLEGLAREVLREQPPDIIKFAAEYFKTQVKLRDGSAEDVESTAATSELPQNDVLSSKKSSVVSKANVVSKKDSVVSRKSSVDSKKSSTASKKDSVASRKNSANPNRSSELERESSFASKKDSVGSRKSSAAPKESAVVTKKSSFVSDTETLERKSSMASRKESSIVESAGEDNVEQRDNEPTKDDDVSTKEDDVEQQDDESTIADNHDNESINEKDAAAVKIQAVVRGHQAREEVKAIRNQSSNIAGDDTSEVQTSEPFEGENVAQGNDNEKQNVKEPLQEPTQESVQKTIPDDINEIDLEDKELEKAAIKIQNSFKSRKSSQKFESTKDLSEKKESNEVSNQVCNDDDPPMDSEIKDVANKEVASDLIDEAPQQVNEGVTDNLERVAVDVPVDTENGDSLEKSDRTLDDTNKEEDNQIESESQEHESEAAQKVKNEELQSFDQVKRDDLATGEGVPAEDSQSLVESSTGNVDIADNTESVAADDVADTTEQHEVNDTNGFDSSVTAEMDAVDSAKKAEVVGDNNVNEGIENSEKVASDKEIEAASIIQKNVDETPTETALSSNQDNAPSNDTNDTQAVSSESAADIKTAEVEQTIQ